VTEASTIEIATRRLQAALDALDSAVGRRLERDQGEAALASQVHAFDADRARLASELDAAAARARGLENVNREVAERLDAAIATIRTIVETPERE
jgi:L-lactate utilization protein LutB